MKTVLRFRIKLRFMMNMRFINNLWPNKHMLPCLLGLSLRRKKMNLPLLELLVHE